MGSGNSHSATFAYEGNADAAPRDFKPGFEPKLIEVRSLEGQVKLAPEKEALPWKQDVAGAVTQLGVDELKVLQDFGVQLASTDDALNKASTQYVLQVWG